MVIAAEYALGEVLWTMLALFLGLIWLALAFRVLGDIFRDPEASGGTKALWALFVVAAPFVGVFVYLMARGGGMAERTIARSRPGSTTLNPHLAPPTDQLRGAAELARAKELLDDGAISQEEYDGLKARSSG